MGDWAVSSLIEPEVILILCVASSECFGFSKGLVVVNASELTDVGNSGVVFFPVDTVIVRSIIPGSPGFESVLSCKFRERHSTVHATNIVELVLNDSGASPVIPGDYSIDVSVKELKEPLAKTSDDSLVERKCDFTLRDGGEFIFGSLVIKPLRYGYFIVSVEIHQGDFICSEVRSKICDCYRATIYIEIVLNLSNKVVAPLLRAT